MSEISPKACCHPESSHISAFHFDGCPPFSGSQKMEVLGRGFPSVCYYDTAPDMCDLWAQKLQGY